MNNHEEPCKKYLVTAFWYTFKMIYSQWKENKQFYCGNKG